MDSDACDLSKSSARELLLLYQKHLPPSAYFYIGKDEDARPEDIIEIRVPLDGQSKKSGHGVVFGFFEKGCPPPDQDILGFPDWLPYYPFSHHITSQFQAKLASHIRERLLNVREHTETKTASDQER